MKATLRQLQKMESLKRDFIINVIEYGFMSDGAIGVLCSDDFGEFSVSIDSNGNITN